MVDVLHSIRTILHLVASTFDGYQTLPSMAKIVPPIHFGLVEDGPSLSHRFLPINSDQELPSQASIAPLNHPS